MSDDTVAQLIESAREVRLRAHAPFSHFLVGAALQTPEGLIVTGCNVESASYGLTICAERVAIFKAISEGLRGAVRIAIVADTQSPTPPCGACRQWLWEFAGDLEVILANLSGDETARYQMRDLLPWPFDSRLLAGPQE
jgi:cytidine deaminase